MEIQKTENFTSLCFVQKVSDSIGEKGAVAYHQKSSRARLDENDLNKRKLNKMRILLMEDNPIAQKSILFALDKVVKNIDMAENGKQGLELFNQNKYDLILLDMNMPILDGYEVAKKIRNIEQGTKIHIPIIAIISNYLVKDIELIMQSGVDDFVKKPLKTNEVIKKINSLNEKES